MVASSPPLQRRWYRHPKITQLHVGWCGKSAELERSLITERTRAGVKAAKQRGVKFGPKPKLTLQQITHARQLRAQGEPVQVIAALLNVHRTTIYRVLAD
jgi:DNA invertase Pin-like site-specific DNA recombinase